MKTIGTKVYRFKNTKDALVFVLNLTGESNNFLLNATKSINLFLHNKIMMLLLSFTDKSIFDVNKYEIFKYLPLLDELIVEKIDINFGEYIKIIDKLLFLKDTLVLVKDRKSLSFLEIDDEIFLICCKVAKEIYGAVKLDNHSYCQKSFYIMKNYNLNLSCNFTVFWPDE